MSYFKVDFCDMSCYGNYYPPTLVNEPIVVAECFDLVTCESILAKIHEAPSGSSGVHDASSGERIDGYHRSSSYINVDPEIYSQVQERITFVANWHVHPQIGRRLKLCEPLQFLKYDSANNGHFNRHTDDSYFANGQFHFVAPHRKFTTVTYLNDNFTGGELVMDTVKDPTGNPFYRKMDRGTTAIFPSDQRFPHEVKPVTSGIRYSIVGWFDFE